MRVGFWFGVAASMLLASMSWAGTPPIVAKKPAPGLRPWFKKPIAAFRFHRIYRQKLREKNVPRLQRNANRLAWRVVLTNLNPWTKRTIQDLIKDVRAASQLSDRAKLGITQARAATVWKANSRGITLPAKVIEKWKMEGFDPVRRGSVQLTATP